MELKPSLTEASESVRHLSWPLDSVRLEFPTWFPVVSQVTGNRGGLSNRHSRSPFPEPRFGDKLDRFAEIGIIVIFMSAGIVDEGDKLRSDHLVVTFVLISIMCATRFSGEIDSDEVSVTTLARLRA